MGYLCFGGGVMTQAPRAHQRHDRRDYDKHHEGQANQDEYVHGGNPAAFLSKVNVQDKDGV